MCFSLTRTDKLWFQGFLQEKNKLKLKRKAWLASLPLASMSPIATIFECTLGGGLANALKSASAFLYPAPRVHYLFNLHKSPTMPAGAFFFKQKG